MHVTCGTPCLCTLIVSRCGKAFGRRGMAGTLEETVFRLCLVHSQALRDGLTANMSSESEEDGHIIASHE